MELFYSTTSPYARKARVFWREKGLEGVIETECNPFNEPPELLRHGTLAKVPTLVTADRVIYESRTICEYMDSLKGEPLAALAGEQHWDMLMAHALTDRLLEYAIGLVLENRRPSNEQSPSAKERQELRIDRALRAMDEFMPRLAMLRPAFSLGHVAFAVALGYMDFRYARLDWRTRFPALGEWYSAQELRTSLLQTQPSDHSTYAL
jgi:glutathione S-transferase